MRLFQKCWFDGPSRMWGFRAGARKYGLGLAILVTAEQTYRRELC